MLNDLLVVRKIKEGDIKTYESVFREYYTPLYYYSFSITGRKEIAEEIVQELFYILWKERENIKIMRSIKNYLYRAVRNESLQYHEYLNVQERHYEKILYREEQKEQITPLENLEYKELEQVVSKVLNKLPDRRLKIYKMHRMEGKKYKEIAEHFSVSIKTVEAEMTKVYQLLRQEIDKYTHNISL